MGLAPKEFHTQSPSGALLTKYWQGHYVPAYSPLTHAVVVAKTPAGIVLERPDGAAFWVLPGATRGRREAVAECVARHLREDLAIFPRSVAVLGFYRVVIEERIEYGALSFCKAGFIDERLRTPRDVQLRTWNGKTTLAALDPVSATLAALVMKSNTWRIS
jgi:ADP-ribose pyrophosphatase YjhB (NUDIX family)